MYVQLGATATFQGTAVYQDNSIESVDLPDIPVEGGGMNLQENTKKGGAIHNKVTYLEVYRACSKDSPCSFCGEYLTPCVQHDEGESSHGSQRDGTRIIVRRTTLCST